MVTKKVLVTGFDAFGGQSLNPSWQVARSLHGRRIAGHTVVSAMLPTVFGASAHKIKELLLLHRPALVLCLGQAGGRSAISLERVAINIDDAPIADNKGAQPIDKCIAQRGPVAYWSTVPIKSMAQAIQRAGIASEISQTAGSFVCNHVFYALMHFLRAKIHAETRGGFVHVPYLPEQCVGALQGQPSMPLEHMVRGLDFALRAALNSAQDLAVGGGATH